MSYYNENGKGSASKEIGAKYGGKDSSGITPLLSPDIQKETFPNLTSLLNGDRYPLLSTLDRRITIAVLVIDYCFEDSSLEEKMNALTGLLFVTGFNTLNRRNNNLASGVGVKSIISMSQQLGLNELQITLRRDAAYDNPKFSEACEELEAQYHFLSRKPYTRKK